MEVDQAKGPAPGWTWVESDAQKTAADLANPLPGQHIGPAAEDRPVTLGDIQDNPRDAFARIGMFLKKDFTDPKTWLTAAALYLGPKAIASVLPVMSKAMIGDVPAPPSLLSRAAAGAKAAAPDLLKAVKGYRATKVMDAVQSARTAMAPPSAAEAPPVAPAPATAAPVAPEAAPTPSPAPVVPAPRVFNEVAIMARRAGIKLTTDQEAEAVALVMKGAKAEDAVTFIKNRSAAEAFATKYGTPTDAEMHADLVARGKAGQKSLQGKVYGELKDWFPVPK